MWHLLKVNLIKAKFRNGSIVGDCYVGSTKYVTNGIRVLCSNIAAYGPLYDWVVGPKQIRGYWRGWL